MTKINSPQGENVNYSNVQARGNSFIANSTAIILQWKALFHYKKAKVRAVHFNHLITPSELTMTKISYSWWLFAQCQMRIFVGQCLTVLDTKGSIVTCGREQSPQHFQVKSWRVEQQCFFSGPLLYVSDYCSFSLRKNWDKRASKRPVIAINAQLPNSSLLTKEQYQIWAMTIHIHGQSGLIITIYPWGSQSVFSTAISQWV